MKVNTRILAALLLLLHSFVPAGAQAADKVLVLNADRQQALAHALDQAVRAQGLAIAPQMLDLLNALRTAPTVAPPELPPNPPADTKKD